MAGQSNEHSHHPRGHPVLKQSRGWRIGSAVLVIVAFVMGLRALPAIVESVSPPFLTHPLVIKDFIQEYVGARAVRDDVNPYVPIYSLIRDYLDFESYRYLHPTPHPPPTLVLAVPLTFVSYPDAARIWLVVELLSLVASVHLLIGMTRRQPRLWLSLVLSTAALAWFPVRDELMLGQLMLPILLLLVVSQRLLRDGHDVAAGALIGASLILKPIVWPLLLYFAITRAWRALTSATGVLSLGYLLAVWGMGLSSVLFYLTDVLPDAATPFRGSFLNISAWAPGWRFAVGTGSPYHYWVQAPPLIDAPNLGKVLTVGIPLLVLIAGLRWACASRNPERALGILVCVSLLVSPITWLHYLVLLLIPLQQLVKTVVERGFPRRMIYRTIAIVALLLPGSPDGVVRLERFAQTISSMVPVVGWQAYLSMLTLLPTLGVFALAIELGRLPNLAPVVRTYAPPQKPEHTEDPSIDREPDPVAPSIGR